MLVLPIKTLLGHYIYDANRNEILAVSKDLFNYISEVQAGEVCPDSYKNRPRIPVTTIMWLLLRFAIAGCRLSIN